MIKKLRATFPGLLPTVAGVLALVAFSTWYDMHLARAANSAPLNVAQVPLTVTTSVHPQVLLLLGNSQSTDGDLSGAINTGAGILSSGDASLYTSSSPSSYTIPSGFTPPVNAGSGGIAPYTVNTGGTLVDNGPSRLNVAKAGIAAILQSYMQNTDFGLEDYSTSGPALYTTYVYYMSPNGGFTFTNTSGNLGSGGATETVPNPCYGYQDSTTSANVKANCTQIAANATLNYGATTLNSNAYMQVLASSDDASINDVLYDGYTNDVFIDYNGPHPGSPYTSFNLANYNAGNVYISYSNVVPNNGVNETGPTNAGYVPFSSQVMYAMRGFGYYTSASGNSGNVVVSLANGNAGQNPSSASVNAAIANFTPFLAAETNNANSGEIKALAVQAPIAGMLTTAKSTLASAASSNGSCTLSQYVILISDGLPTEDLSGKSWPPAGSSAAAGYGMVAFNSDGSLNTGANSDQALIDTINSITALKTAGVKTYVVGLGAGVDPALNMTAAQTLTAMAVAGGTGAYIAATSPAALVSGLNSVLTAIQQGSLSTSAVAVNSTNLQSGDLEFQASFTSSDTPFSDWTGQVIATALDPTTGLPTGTPVWSAQTQLDNLVVGTGYLTNRAIATWNPTAGSLAQPAGVGFTWGNLNATQQAQLNLSDSNGQNRLLYLRGNTAQEVHNGGTFRNRSHILGDIVDSQPYFEKIGSSQLLYAGGNDGMLHAFNAQTGNEQFAFIPNAVFAKLANLTQPLYNQSHQFFVDGSPNVGTVLFDDGLQHTLVVSGENGGGNSVFALDVTNPTTLTSDASVAAAVKWEFTDADLGLTYSQPQIAQLNAAPGSAVIFGNGYNSPNNNSVLYFVNPQYPVSTGHPIIAKINLCSYFPTACNAALPQGLSTVAVAQSDGLQNQPITQVYAGDLQGNLWAVDVSNASPSNWTVRLLFQATSPLGGSTVPAPGSPQPITTPPVVTLNPSYPKLLGNFVMFGTGQLLQASDLNTTQTQSVYGIFDRMPATNVTLTRANLTAQSISVVSAATAGLPQGILLGTNNTVSLVSSSGWYDDLLPGGQRVITNPALLYGAFLATLNTPPGSTCGAQFSSDFLELNYATGGTFSSPQLDINNSGTVNNTDMYNGAAPIGLVLGPGYASEPVILGHTPGPGPGNPYKKSITLSNGTQKVPTEQNNTPPRSSWWQIQ
jgi:type IV pilus assembly protein PilY1